MKLYVESIRDALDRCMAKSNNVYIIGEDIVDPYGGAFKVTKGLSSKYPERVVTTPISESAVIGISTGLAIRGMRPVAEIMFGDFLTLCCDQIINNATKFPLMYKGKVFVPIVIRTPVGGARGYGPTHSQSLEKLFFGVPGLTVICPNILSDPGEILEKILSYEKSPVLFIEDKGDYSRKVLNSDLTNLLQIKDSPNDPYPISIYKNYSTEKVPDIVIISYGGAASIAADVLRDIANEEIRSILIAPAAVNNINKLRKMLTLIPQSVPLLIVEQGTYGFGWSSEIMALILESGINFRKCNRLTAASDIIPAARKLEAEVIITYDKIINEIFTLIS